MRPPYDPVMGRVSFSVGLAAEHKAAAVDLYLNAFAAQLAPMLRDDARSRAFLARSFRPGHCLCALHDGALAGIAGFHDDDGGFIGFSARDLIRSFGVIGGIRRVVGFLGAAPEYDADDFLADGFVIAPELRRRGVGRAMVGELTAMARRAGCGRLIVDVRVENQAATRFYHQCGFAVQAESNQRFNHKVRMEKAVQGG